MGDYATRLSDGEYVKIGSCGDLFYLRPNQMNLISTEQVSGFSDRVMPHLSFRFPFPDEDNLLPGQFTDHTHGLRVWGFNIGPELPHHDIQFKADAGILATLPCPYSRPAQESGITYHFNGYSGPVKIVRQGWRNDMWATLVECGACGARYALADLDDARPLLEALEKMAVIEENPFRGQRPKLAATYREVAHRIEIGYTSPIPPAELRAV